MSTADAGEMMSRMIAEQKERAEKSRLGANKQEVKMPTQMSPERVKKYIEGAEKLTEPQWNSKKNKNAGDPRPGEGVFRAVGINPGKRDPGSEE